MSVHPIVNIKPITSALCQKIVYNLDINGKVIKLTFLPSSLRDFFLVKFSRVYVTHQESLMEH